MSRDISRLFFTFILILAGNVLDAGGTGKPDGTGKKSNAAVIMVDHNLSLPPGFTFSDNGVLPMISTDYHEVHFVRKSFELPKDILSKGQLPKNRMSSFLWLHNQNLELEEVDKIVRTYIKESAIEGVNHDIAFVQMILETGYLRFTGDVSKTQNNFCGLGAYGDGVKGLYFSTIEEGIRAHIQHLKAYASKEPLKNDAITNRIRFVNRGSVQSFHDLTGKWATDPMYGKKIDHLLNKIYEGVTIQQKPTSILFD